MEKEAVPLVIIGEQNEVIFKTENLESLLCREEIKDHLIVVLSIAGSPRKGKSFMMKFAGIYLRFLCQSNPDADWLDIEKLPSVFVSKCGTNKVTNGIQMWPEVFLTTLPDDQKVAIILLDTQGSFDRESTVKESVTVFALTTMISSVQIYNLSKNIEGRDLQQLELFTEYGKLASGKRNRKQSKPFQKLLFLIRDWTSLDEAPNGTKGGQMFLNKIFEETRNMHEENKSLRENIKSSFNEMNCFLMPPPSDHVMSDKEFTGKVEDFVGSVFYRYLKEFIPSLLAPENLLPKEIHGVRITVNEFVSHFKNYVKVFTSDKLLPEPKTILMAIVEASNEKFSKSALDIYNKMMMTYCNRGTLISIDDLKSEHEKCQADALIYFDRADCHMGGDELYFASYKKLEEDIQSSLKNYIVFVRQTNQSIAKNECEKGFRDALLHYYESMTEYCNGNTVSFDELDREHGNNSLKAIEILQNNIKKFNDTALYDIGEVNFYQPCIEKLKQVMDTMYKRFSDNVCRVHKAFIAVNNNEAFIRAILHFQNATKNIHSIEKINEMISKLTEKKIEALRMFDEMRNEKNDELWEPLWKKLEKEINDMMTSFINQKKEMDEALSSASVSTIIGRIGVGLIGGSAPLFPVNPGVAGGALTIGLIAYGCSEMTKGTKTSKKKNEKKKTK